MSSALTLSQPPPRDLRLPRYRAGVVPSRKRLSEARALRELEADYPSKDISDCLDHLTVYGIPHSKEPCHSPLAYLAKAMGQVLTVVRAEAIRAEYREKAARLQARRKIEDSKRTQQEQLELELRERAFVETFPTPEAQLAVVTRLSDRFPWFSANGKVLRGLAISEWWRECEGELVNSTIGSA